MKSCLGAPLHRAPQITNRVLAALAMTFVSTASALAQSSLTLADAQRQAIERSRMLVAQDSAINASREMAVSAAQLPDPIAKLGVNNLPVNGEDRFSLTRDFMTMRSVGIMQELTRAEKREARAGRFEREAEKSLAEKSVTIAAIQRETAIAWLDRYYAEAMTTVVSEQSRAAAAEVEAAEGGYRAGRGNLADLLSARAALIALDDRASELSRKVRAAKIALARWLGDGAEAPLAGSPSIDSIGLDPSALEADLMHHPELAVLSRKEDVAAAEVRVAQANKQADWSVELMYSQRGAAYSNMISVAVSVPLQWDRTNRQDREVASKLAMLDQARAEREDKLRAHVAEIRAMIAEWENDRERSVRYARELLPLASERTEATVGAYRGAKASLTDVLLARRNEIDVRIQALQLEMETARLWAQLNFLAPESNPATRAGLPPTKDSQ